jgi:hypothetical protein
MLAVRPQVGGGALKAEEIGAQRSAPMRIKGLALTLRASGRAGAFPQAAAAALKLLLQQLQICSPWP